MSARRIQFGYCVPIFAQPGGGLFRTPALAALDAPGAVRAAVEAEALGFDSLWVADHLMLGQAEAVLEGWTTLAAIAGATRRAKLGLIHQAHYFRHPAVAAKMMATLDVLADGRFIFFADTGTRSAEHQAYGLRYPAAMEERMTELLEGLDLILRLWQSSANAPITFTGQFYQVKEAVCAPPPVTRPHPPLWLGEAHPLTLEACARLAQGWNSAPVGLAELERRLNDLRAACARAGRSFADLEISYETQVLIAPSREAVRDQLRAMLALTPAGAEPPQAADFAAFVNGDGDDYPRYLREAWLVGTPAEVRAQVEAYVGLGVRHFLLWFMDAPRTAGMRLFMDAVAAVATDLEADEADGGEDPAAV